MVKLKKIYSTIPEMECKKGCKMCCGLIRWFPVENENIQRYMDKNNIENVHWSIEQYAENDFICPYCKNNRCIIYPVRPVVCRLQGHISKLPCPHKNTFDLSTQKGDMIMRTVVELNKIYCEKRQHGKT